MIVATPLCLYTLRMISNHSEGTFGRLRYLLGGDRPLVLRIPRVFQHDLPFGTVPFSGGNSKWESFRSPRRINSGILLIRENK